MSRYYNMDGEPITLKEWMRTSDDARRVALDERGDVRVSTVLLGLNHQWDLNGPPLIFETMIFGGDRPPRASPPAIPGWIWGSPGPATRPAAWPWATCWACSAIWRRSLIIRS